MTAEASKPQNGNRIILIEDQQPLRIAIRMYLELDGHIVECVGSLQELDTLLERMVDCPDLIITDFHLSDTERGGDAIDRIRRQFAVTVPAIVLTGDTSKVPARILGQPRLRTLNKPVSATELSTAVVEMLGASH